MKKDSFIKTVLSHITDTTRKAEVLAELGDHLQEKTDYFEELGYEKEPAAEKAEQALGELDDARTVGEQLAAIKKPHRAVRVLLLMASLLLLFASFVQVFFVFSGGVEIDFISPPACFGTFIRAQLLWVACLGLLCLCRRFHAVAGMLLCLPSVLVIHAGSVMNPIYVIKAALSLKNVGELLCYADFGGYAMPNGTLGTFLFFLVSALVLLSAITAVVLEIKKRNLCFSRLDISVQRAVKAVLIGIFAFSVLLGVATGILFFTGRQTAEQKTAAAMEQMDTFIIEHMEEILSEDKTAAREALKQAFPHMSVGEDLACGSAGMRFYTYQKGGHSYFRLFSVLQDMEGDAVEVSSEQVLEQAKACDKTDIHNLPKPYALAVSESSYGAGEEGIVPEVLYGDHFEYANEYDDALRDKVLYRYEAGNGFVYINSVFSTLGKPYDYDAAHEAMLAQALKAKIAHPERYRDFLSCESEIYEKIFAVSYDKVLGQYQADMEVAVDYWAEIGGKIYSVVPEAVDIISVTYKIENGKAVILELWQSEDWEEYETSIKNRFSQAAYKAWEKTDYTNALHSDEAMYRRIKKNCGKSPYAHIVMIDPATGECEYYVYTVFGALEKDVKYMRLGK